MACHPDPLQAAEKFLQPHLFLLQLAEECSILGLQSIAIKSLCQALELLFLCLDEMPLGVTIEGLFFNEQEAAKDNQM
ncbi:hypothetical protein NW759_010562 [Fusarium solani]|nr:hypothetical protein NW759_010562 [Fusarium solani]